MSQGIVLSGADIDFMIHGIVKYNFEAASGHTCRTRH